MFGKNLKNRIIVGFNAETIKELFPEDEELYQKIKKMKEKQKEEEEKLRNSNKKNEEVENGGK